MGRSWRQLLLALWVVVLSQLVVGASAQCIDNISFLVQRELAVTDTSVKRSYTLCPRVMYFIAQFDLNYEYVGTNVMPAIPLRPNLELKCGDDGKRTNLCWIMNGDVHLDGTKVLGTPDERIDNVVLEGFVFISAKKYSFWGMKPGSITFRDCEWRVRNKDPEIFVSTTTRSKRFPDFKQATHNFSLLLSACCIALGSYFVCRSCVPGLF